MTLTRSLLLSTSVALALAGCTGSPSDLAATGPGEPPAGTTVVVGLTPLVAQVSPGGSISFVASVTGTADAGVVWSVQEGAAGGSVTTGGVYVAPASAGTYHVVAAAHADPAKFQVATVSVVAAGPVGVSVSPVSSAADACGSISFSATVTGTNDPTVVWSVKEGPAGGSVTPGGVYTAPGGAAGTFHVVASSVADPSRSAEAAVVVGPEKVLSVAINPGSSSTTPSGAVAFAAIVTTSCGSFAAQ